LKPPEESLCTACGLCCDGTLFGSVRLAPGEAARIGLPVLGELLPQPCAALEGARCAIYAARPAGCRAFDCLLLHALRDGEVGLDEALQTVAEARRRVAASRSGAEPFLDLRFRGRQRQR
jgi:uncharacterized protein